MSKAFDTVDHSILIKKLKLCGITDKNLAWFESYLSNRKQYIYTGRNSKSDLHVLLLASLSDILGPLLFLVHVKDLLMFADDTNLFFNRKDIKNLFTVVNKELANMKDWFTANKLSLNVETTKC